MNFEMISWDSTVFCSCDPVRHYENGQNDVRISNAKTKISTLLVFKPGN